MVSGAVLPPQVDLTNEDLIRAHVHAVWLAEAGLSLGTSLKDLLDISGDEPSMALLEQVRDAVHADRPKQQAEKRAATVLASILDQLVKSDWHTQDWLHEVMSHIPISFEQACDRWRSLYLSALRQAQKQDRVIRDASRPAGRPFASRTAPQKCRGTTSPFDGKPEPHPVGLLLLQIFCQRGFPSGLQFPAFTALGLCTWTLASGQEGTNSFRVLVSWQSRNSARGRSSTTKVPATSLIR